VSKPISDKQRSKDNAEATPSKYKIFQSKGFLFASFIISIFLVTLTNVISSDLAKTNSNIFFIILPAVLSILSVRLVVKFPSKRTMLLAFALFSILSAIAEDLFIVYESVFNVNPFPSIADGFWLAGYLALSAFFVLYLKPLRKTIPKKVVILASLVSIGFLIPSVNQAYLLNADSDKLALAIVLIYPIFDALFLCPVIICMTVLYNKRSNPFLLAMLIAILSFIASDSIYLAIYNSYENGNPIDIGWIIGYILFSYAVISFKPTSQNQLTSVTVDLENKKIVNAISSEAIIQFVIPLVVMSIIMIGSIFLADYYFKEKARDPEANLVPIYLFFSILASLLLVIFVINRNLIRLVKMRTRELEDERDVLKLQNEEKMQLIARSGSLERQLQKSLSELKVVEKSKDEFVAMITHELKTPLVPIRGYVELLLSERMGNLNDAQKKRLNVIQTSSESLLRLISDLLDVQKIELGQLKLDKQENDLTEIINSVIVKIKPQLEQKGIIITQELEAHTICLCDKGRIDQVLNNLFLNSMDFVPKENGKISITLNQHDKVEIIIKDNGIGIEKDQLEKLFVKFYQVNTSTTREHAGTGLGLSICKGIIENHGGKIWAKSEGLGKGTEFHIMLPT
jgi:signal transduction histidine kinase